MRRDSSAETGYFSEPDLVFRTQEETARAAAQRDEQVVPRPGYLVELCGEPIPLDLIEYRILTFLARKPYKAYTRRQIVEAIRTPEEPVTEQTLDQHIQSLRQKLGLFSDYVQSVPYVGYRFKA
jgi:DNA-binding response OmpR family regulator